MFMAWNSVYSRSTSKTHLYCISFTPCVIYTPFHTNIFFWRLFFYVRNLVGLLVCPYYLLAQLLLNKLTDIDETLQFNFKVHTWK